MLMCVFGVCLYILPSAQTLGHYEVCKKLHKSHPPTPPTSPVLEHFKCMRKSQSCRVVACWREFFFFIVFFRRFLRTLHYLHLLGPPKYIYAVSPIFRSQNSQSIRKSLFVMRDVYMDILLRIYLYMVYIYSVYLSLLRNLSPADSNDQEGSVRNSAQSHQGGGGRRGRLAYGAFPPIFARARSCAPCRMSPTNNAVSRFDQNYAHKRANVRIRLNFHKMNWPEKLR